MITVVSAPAEPDPPETEGAGVLEYVSASRLKTFQECRLKFYFHYVARIPTRTSPALFVGQVVHAVLQQWNLRRWREEPAGIEILRTVFDERWDQDQDGIRWSGKETQQKETAWNILEHYLEHTPIPVDERPEAVEVTVERDFIADGFPPLLGVIDLVRSQGRIVDFKTTSRSPDPVMAEHLNEIQLCCYAVLYREATGHPEGGMEIHHLVKTKQPKLIVTPLAPMTPDQARRLMRIMESYVQGIEAEDYIPSPGQHCAWCDHLAECRAWY